MNMNPHFHVWLARTAMFLFILAVLSPPSVVAQPTARSSKIRGDIFHHQRLKFRPAGRSVAAHNRFVFDQGLNGQALDREQIAVYVSNRLSRLEIQELLKEGIELDPDSWIPPLSGHPLGFHIGTAKYSSLSALDSDSRILRVDSVESSSRPSNDVGTALIHVDAVRAGTGLNSPRNGAGVRIAIADSGVDLFHGDLSAPAESYDVTDGLTLATWGTGVTNFVTGHGTHVTGTVVGNGTLSGGRYAGGATGATWAFYKIANDMNGSASSVDEIKAIQRADSLGYEVFTMSFGGLGDFFMDGSGPMEQAIDAAVANGVTVFISAGNEATTAQHDSATVSPSTASATFGIIVTNPAPETIQVIWRDNQPNDLNVRLTCNNLSAGESLVESASGTSSRATEARQYILTPNISPGTQKTYNLQLTNASGSGAAPLVHCYAQNTSRFANPDPAYTINSPAIADGAIAVGAWVHRAWFTNSTGTATTFGEVQGGLASFSSRGPRIDGVLKPDIVAPGTHTISLLDGNNASLVRPTEAFRIIDNDGLNGIGPANYAALQGTSMATPLAAAVGALILQENPTLTPTEVRNILALSASSSTAPNFDIGYGLIDTYAAVQEADYPAVWVDFNYVGMEVGTFHQPFNTLAEGVTAAPNLPGNAYAPRIRIKTGTSSEKLTINKRVGLNSVGGPATIGN
jgi:subtilisin family serine protease